MARATENVGGSTPPADGCHGDAAARRSVIIYQKNAPGELAVLGHGGDVDAWMAARLMFLKSQGRTGQRMVCMAWAEHDHSMTSGRAGSRKGMTGPSIACVAWADDSTEHGCMTWKGRVTEGHGRQV